MRRVPAPVWVSAFAVGLVLAITGCSSGGGSRSTQAEQAMYAAVSKPVNAATSLPAGQKWAGGPGDGLRLAVPEGWVSVTLAYPGSPGGSAGDQAVMSLSCAAAQLPAGTSALTGLNTLAEQEFTAINSSNAQLGQTTVDGRTAVLVYNQMSVGTANVTALQYAIAAPGGRTCFVTLATQKQVPFMPVFSRLRPAIQVLGAA